MPNITLAISDETRKKMDAHSHIKWSNVVRSIILQKLEDFEAAEKLAKKSRLTEKDISKLAEKINRAMGKHAEALLNENYSRR